MTNRAVMQQALECIERLNMRGFILADFEDEVESAINALREALAQPEQEPVAWADMDVRGEDKGLSWTPGHFHKTPLYTTPPQRTWVGLTDEEIKALASWWPSYDQMPALMVLAKDIQNSLKEKNT